jgi:hypothetical protein
MVAKLVAAMLRDAERSRTGIAVAAGVAGLAAMVYAAVAAVRLKTAVATIFALFQPATDTTQNPILGRSAFVPKTRAEGCGQVV